MSDQIIVSESMLDPLKATRPWVKFLAILGFIGISLMIIVGLCMVLALSAFPAKPGMPAFGPAFGILYLVLAAIYLMPCLFLYRYSRAIAEIPGTGQSALEEALKNQKSFWKFMGVVALVIVSLEVLVIVFGILAALVIGRH